MKLHCVDSVFRIQPLFQNHLIFHLSKYVWSTHYKCLPISENKYRCFFLTKL